MTRAMRRSLKPIPSNTGVLSLLIVMSQLTLRLLATRTDVEPPLVPSQGAPTLNHQTPWDELPSRRHLKERPTHQFAFPKSPPARIETIVMARLAGGAGTLCNSEDWRGEFPRYLAGDMHRAKVLIYTNARGSASKPECHFCTKDGLKSEGPFDCNKWMAEQNRTADALILVGAGTHHCEAPDCKPWNQVSRDNEFMLHHHTSIYHILSRPWVTDDTYTIHIPVSNSKVLNNNDYGFSRVIHDSDFPKPPSKESLAITRHCGSGKKEKTVIYAARYSTGGHKGQERFLAAIDPEDVAGFKIVFYGHNLKPGIKKNLERIAAERGLKIEVNGFVRHETLMLKLCNAKGTIIFSKRDMNPRVAYEGMPAGNPVYLSTETHVPAAIRALPFVFADSCQAVKHGGQREDALPEFHFFMQAVRHADQKYHEHVSRYALQALDRTRVYHRICVDSGLCHRPTDVSDEDEDTPPTPKVSPHKLSRRKKRARESESL